MATRKHRIAVIPGDGIGKETTPEGLRVLDAAARRFGFELDLTHYDWSCETYVQTGPAGVPGMTAAARGQSRSSTCLPARRAANAGRNASATSR